jgi:hypothetical protein
VSLLTAGSAWMQSSPMWKHLSKPPSGKLPFMEGSTNSITVPGSHTCSTLVRSHEPTLNTNGEFQEFSLYLPCQEIPGLFGVVAVVVLPPCDDLQHYDAKAEGVRFHPVVPPSRVLRRHVPTVVKRETERNDSRINPNHRVNRLLEISKLMTNASNNVGSNPCSHYTTAPLVINPCSHELASPRRLCPCKRIENTNKNRKKQSSIADE